MNLSQEKEDEIVGALTHPGLPWTEDLDGTSWDIISKYLHCSTEDAKCILEEIYHKKKRIAAVSEYGGNKENVPPGMVSRWKWVKNPTTF